MTNLDGDRRRSPHRAGAVWSFFMRRQEIGPRDHSAPCRSSGPTGACAKEREKRIKNQSLRWRPWGWSVGKEKGRRSALCPWSTARFGLWRESNPLNLFSKPRTESCIKFATSRIRVRRRLVGHIGARFVGDFETRRWRGWFAPRVGMAATRDDTVIRIYFFLHDQCARFFLDGARVWTKFCVS